MGCGPSKAQLVAEAARHAAEARLRATQAEAAQLHDALVHSQQTAATEHEYVPLDWVWWCDQCRSCVYCEQKSLLSSLYFDLLLRFI
jgi:hypothetical protein